MTTSKIPFTAGRISKFCCEAGKAASFLWDISAPGLGLKASAGGAKNYILQSRLESGASIRLTIGDVRTWTLSAARDEARRLQTLIDQGIDPRQEKADRLAATEAKRAEAEAKKIQMDRFAAPAMEAWQAYLVARTPKWGARSLLDHQSVSAAGGKPKVRARHKGAGETTLPGILRPLLDLPLEQITADRVCIWLKDEADRRPTQASLAFRLLRGFLNWCSDQDAYEAQVRTDACARKAKDELPKQGVKDDCLQREQLPLWFAHVRQIGNPVVAAYLQALLLTGARREELAGLTWEDLDFQWKSMTIRDKVAGERIIPLTPYVASMLAALPRRNQWVFASPRLDDCAIQDKRTMHVKALAAAGLPALTLHGLRRSFGTLSEWCEVPAGVVAQIMGHKPSAIAEKHYRRRPLDLLRMWHTKIEGWILEQAGIEQPAEETRPGLRVVTAA